MKTTIKCIHIAQQYLIGGGHDLFCQRDGRSVTVADCFKCKSKTATQPKGAAK